MISPSFVLAAESAERSAMTRTFHAARREELMEVRYTADPPKYILKQVRSRLTHLVLRYVGLASQAERSAMAAFLAVPLADSMVARSSVVPTGYLRFILLRLCNSRGIQVCKSCLTNGSFCDPLVPCCSGKCNSNGVRSDFIGA